MHVESDNRCYYLYPQISCSYSRVFTPFSTPRRATSSNVTETRFLKERFDTLYTLAFLAILIS